MNVNTTYDKRVEDLNAVNSTGKQALIEMGCEPKFNVGEKVEFLDIVGHPHVGVVIAQPNYSKGIGTYLIACIRSFTAIEGNMKRRS